MGARQGDGGNANNAAANITEEALITIAVSSRALFDFEQENKLFEDKGEAAYMKRQRELLDGDSVVATGVAYPMVKKLLAFNTKSERLVDVIVISRNDPITGLRVFRSISEHGLDILRGCFTRGRPSLPYLQAFGAHLFLSAFEDDVRVALEAGAPAARVMVEKMVSGDDGDQLRIAFDGDAVLFDDTSERVHQEKGLDAFQKREKARARQPLAAGPFQPFLAALSKLRQKLPDGKIRIALITARGAPAHERAIRTLMDWGIDIDEAFFLGGRQKAEILEGFAPDFFFDDQLRHLDRLPESTGGGHVAAGVMNESQ